MDAERLEKLVKEIGDSIIHKVVSEKLTFIEALVVIFYLTNGLIKALAQYQGLNTTEVMDLLVQGIEDLDETKAN